MATVLPDLSRGPVLLSVSVGTASFAFSTTIIRFCVRTRISNDFGPDDYAMGAATLIAFTATILSILEASATESASALEFDVLGQPWFLMGATLAKISICLFFIRLMGGARSWGIPLSIVIFVMAVVNFTFSLTVNLQCRPLEKLWHPTVDGQCWDPSVQLDFGYFQGAFSVFSWVFLALFPIMVLRDLEMPGKLRWPFYILAALSLMSGIFSIARTSELSGTGGVSAYASNYLNAQVLAVLEQNVGIVAANVLPMGPLFSRRSRGLSRAKSTGSDSTRAITNAGSRGPSRMDSSHDSRPNTARSDSSRRSSFLDLKRLASSVTESRRLSADVTDTRHQYPLSDLDFDGRSIRSIDALDPEAWPNGIIKTVSVEVVEEENPDHVPRPGHHHTPSGNSAEITSLQRGGSRAGMRGHATKLSEVSVEHDWETMLRQGPPGP